jgi:adenine-specific DNA-methyltransferase
VELNKIYNMDCIKYMKTLPDESVDLIIADPPYNIGKDYGNDSDKQSESVYLKFINDLCLEFNRILKLNGTLFLYTGKQYYANYYLKIKELFNIKNQIVWTYDSSGVQAKTKYGSLYEPIIYATKHKSKYTFNKEMAMVEAKTGSKRQLIDYRKTPPQPYNTQKVDGDVWSFTRVRYKMSEYTNHPTQKPLSICNRIINVHSNENDIIYIPFAGSGSEIESCIINNRNWIATELNKDYIDEIIIPRISKYEYK